MPRKPTERARRQGRPVSIGPTVLVEVVCDLLRHTRPDHITIALVARKAKVDPKLIHYYFTDRAGLLRAAAASLSAQFQAEAAQATGETARDRLKARIAVFLRFQKKFPYFHRLMIEEIFPQQEDESMLQQVSTRGIQGYRAILEDGVASGEMRLVDVPLLYLSLIGMVEMLSIGGPILRETGHPQFPPEDFAEEASAFIVDLLFNGLRAG